MPRIIRGVDDSLALILNREECKVLCEQLMREFIKRDPIEHEKMVEILGAASSVAESEG